MPTNRAWKCPGCGGMVVHQVGRIGEPGSMMVCEGCGRPVSSSLPRGRRQDLHVGDVVQIDPEHDPVFGAAFMVIEEVKSWGYQGYVTIPGQEGVAPYRVPWEKCAGIGPAVWLLEGVADDELQPEERMARELTDEQIDERIRYHAPSEEGAARHTRLADAYVELMKVIDEECPPGREKALAFTHLETSKMWGSGAIARNPETR